MIAAFQGIDGAFSQLVVAQFLRDRGLDASTLGMPTYREVATAVSAERASAGVIPIENAIVGTVREGYDLVAEFELAPVAEVLCRTDHRLLGVHGASLEDVREVLAHPLTIAECSRFLQSLKNARAIPCEDTGVAAREVARGGNSAVAALAPPAAARIYDLDELAANCGDHPSTYSRFLIVRPKHQAAEHPIALLAHSDRRKTSIIFSLEDAPGRLARCLAEFAERGVNLSKLESKPRLGHGSDHVFYVDLDGDARNARVEEALRNVRRLSVQVTLLGSYDAHVGVPLDYARGALRQAQGDTQAIAVAASWHPQPVHVHNNEALPRVSRPARPHGSALEIGGVRIGDGEFAIIAGPCSVESREQVLLTAHAVKARGAVMLRGGAFKPRTSPYAFQGLGWEGVDLLAEAGRATGLPTVSEVMTVDQVAPMARQIDVLQIGARNMQNFDLLKAVGRSGKPVLLKRGLSATIDELLAAAEYILAEGNPNVMLCERGIRTFETATRNTLDLSAVPVLRERSHLPVLVDPSHGVGVRRWIAPLCRAAKAVGAHGILVEVHPNPPEAKSDKEQALTFDDFASIVNDLAEIPLCHGKAPKCHPDATIPQGRATSKGAEPVEVQS
ncbi:MAG TPA: 3-deoxy-7-phosphoheptulonate synthase [Candidatus Baltobacteraceae bacterium]|nr:3-deoxy-7-phosphoheptulonate synthase [Candidatus Baltobacteraceae bacterium]